MHYNCFARKNSAASLLVHTLRSSSRTRLITLIWVQIARHPSLTVYSNIMLCTISYLRIFYNNLKSNVEKNDFTKIILFELTFSLHGAVYSSPEGRVESALGSCKVNRIQRELVKFKINNLRTLEWRICFRYTSTMNFCRVHRYPPVRKGPKYTVYKKNRYSPSHGTLSLRTSFAFHTFSFVYIFTKKCIIFVRKIMLKILSINEFGKFSSSFSQVPVVENRETLNI